MGLFPPAPGGGAQVEHGYKGKGSLLHVLSDFQGNPLAITTTSAKGDERKELCKLVAYLQAQNFDKCLHQRQMIILEADKGYDSGKIRQLLLTKGIFPFIPYRRIGSNSNRPTRAEVAEYFNITTVRWRVERTFAWLKRKCRRLLMRWERLPIAWNSFATLALIYFWKGNLLG